MNNRIAYNFIVDMLESNKPVIYYLPPDTPLNNIPGSYQEIYVNNGQIRMRIDIKEDGQLRSTWVEYIDDNGTWIDINFPQEIWVQIHHFLENIWEECSNKKIALGELNNIE